MKVYVTYEDSFSEWVEKKETFPKSFVGEVNPGKPLEYDTFLTKWKSERIRKYESNSSIRNVKVVGNEIRYESLEEDYLEKTERLDIDTLDELKQLMEKYEKSYFTFEESSGRWLIE